MTANHDVEVLIVGAGPAGATLALLLAQRGIKVCAISRHHGTANTPRAHIFNQRAMEVLRDAGIEARALEVVSPPEAMQNTTWSHSLASEEFGRMWAWGNKPSERHRYDTASPCSMNDLPQSFLEPILVDAARGQGASISFSTEFVSFESRDDRVTTTMRDRKTGTDYDITSRFLIGADGARSAILQCLDIPVDGKQLNSAFNAHIKADLTRYLAHRPASLNWVLNPEAPDWSAVGNFRMVRPWNEFVVSMHPLHGAANAKDPTPEQIIKRLHQMIGDDTVEIELLSTFRWTINDQVARTWQKGSVLCIGDAVHRHPPINGLGSNTCISDAFNLAWKLAYVLRGFAKPALLDSLTIERKPVGDAIVRRANDGMKVHRELWALAGLTQEDRHETIKAWTSPTAEGREARAHFRSVLARTDLEFQAIGIQMNQVYAGSPATYVEIDDQPPELWGFDMLKEVVTSTYPGYHLPHVWLAASGQAPRVSTLDVCGRGHFTVLTGLGGDCWVQAAAELGATAKFGNIKAVTIGFRQDYLDLYGGWEQCRGVEENGVVVVRPDHFIAWRYPAMSENAVALLGDALAHVLSH
ncbi:hypothetical protein LTR53_003641 [Teratosphaeriaceae sp. CCFEE 6253]|nr:hypothetical protein LTR53_003641 [Teratosphaeriaceae sp. CCFEE 6253]